MTHSFAEPQDGNTKNKDLLDLVPTLSAQPGAVAVQPSAASAVPAVPVSAAVPPALPLEFTLTIFDEADGRSSVPGEVAK